MTQACHIQFQINGRHLLNGLCVEIDGCEVLSACISRSHKLSPERQLSAPGFKSPISQRCFIFDPSEKEMAQLPLVGLSFTW